MSGLLRVARGFGPRGRLVLATGSAGDTANSSGVERSHGGPFGCVSDSVERQVWALRGLLRVARGFGPGGRLVLATGSAGDTADRSGVERSHGPPFGCVSDSVDTQAWALRGLLRVARGFGPCSRLVFATGSPGDTANSSGVERSHMDHLDVFLTAWIRMYEGSGLGAKLCGIADDAF